MIRIPFSPGSDMGISPAAPESPRSLRGQTGSERFVAIEARLAALELRLAIHAEEVQDEVTDRVDRIRSRFERAIRHLTSDLPEGEPLGNVVEFSTDRDSPEPLHAANAKEALYELNETLQLTREHLDALGCSVARMRAAVSAAS